MCFVSFLNLPLKSNHGSVSCFNVGAAQSVRWQPTGWGLAVCILSYCNPSVLFLLYVKQNYKLMCLLTRINIMCDAKVVLLANIVATVYAFLHGVLFHICVTICRADIALIGLAVMVRGSACVALTA